MSIPNLGVSGLRSTFGTCAGYTSHFIDCSLPVGALLQSNTPDFFTAAEGNTSAAATGSHNPQLGEKQSRELLDSVGTGEGI